MALSTSCSHLSWRLLHIALMTSFCALSCVAEEKARMTSREPLKSLESVSPTQHVQKLNTESDGVDCRPKWKFNPDDIATHFVVLENDTFRLRCPAERLPKLTIRWLKNGIDFNSRWKGEITRKGFTLEVREAVSFDEGNYTCIVSNRCGYIQQDFFVKVIVRYFGKPVFDGPIQNQTVTVGSTVILVCRTLSDVVQMVYWMFENSTDSSILRELKTDERHFVNATHLIIHSVQLNDSGPYVCVAINEFGWNKRIVWIFVSNPGSKFNHDGKAVTDGVALTERSLTDSKIDSHYYNADIDMIIVAVLSGVFVLLSISLISAFCIRRSRKKKDIIDKGQSDVNTDLIIEKSVDRS